VAWNEWAELSSVCRDCFMLFNSYTFIFLFLPTALLVYYGCAKLKTNRMSIQSLVFASLVFYVYWDIKYLPLLLVSITFNYLMSRWIRAERNFMILMLAVGINIFLLMWFKYTVFLLETMNDFFHMSFIIPEIVLPLGISFFTFTQIAFLVDCYRGETQERSFLEYALFVTVFPHLIAGPILHHRSIIPQFSEAKSFLFSSSNMITGLCFFCIGLMKKVIIADTLGGWARPVFENAAMVSFFDGWFGAICYSLQLYYDFSAYSEMAIGLALMFNIRFPVNFNSPYHALSVKDFWRRWHITLSQFLKNYLYIPLGGNRHGTGKTMLNIFLTMLLGGLWHGAGWNFLIWGALHGLYLISNHGWERIGFRLPIFFAWLITFSSIVVGWVIFRANNMIDAINILQAMAGIKGIVFPSSFSGIPFVGALLGEFHFADLHLLPPNWKLGASILTIFFLLLATSRGSNVQQFLGYSSEASETRKAMIIERYPRVCPVLLGIGFFLVLKFIAEAPPSEFLYFNF
jgi:alginate O-acetyltransferase complex protein AlgI